MTSGGPELSLGVGRGIGAALWSPRLFANLCERGELIAPFRWQVRGPNSYWLLWKGDNPEPHFVS